MLEHRQDGSLIGVIAVICDGPEAKGKGKKCKVTNMLVDGLGVVSMLTQSGRGRLADRIWFRMVDYSKRSDTLRIRRTSRRI